MYTGMNDQILDLSYNFDNMFYVAIGAQSEIIDSFKFLPGVRYDESLRKTLDEARIASNNLKLYNQMSKLGTSDDDKRTRDRLQAQIIKNDPILREQVNANEFNMSPNETTRLITRRVEAYEAAVVRGGTALRENQNPDPVGSNVDVYNVPGAVATENEKELSNTNEGQTLTKRLNNSNVRSVVSDIQALGVRNPGTGSNTVFVGDMTRQAFADYYKDKPLPPMFYETGKVTQTGVEGDTTPGGGLLAQYFNNAKNVGSTGDMMNVEMTIKGDLTFLPDLSRNNSKNTDVVTRKPLMIIVTSNQVSEYNKDGFMRINTKNALNGLYMVIEANHKWTDEGQYIITLGLRRELGTDLHGLAFRAQMQNYEY